MQQINGEQQQQLPANIIKETTSPPHNKHVNKNTKSASNRFDKITRKNQQQSPLQRLQTDQPDLDTYRSLSTCPTYSSLSRHSPETRECGTQITTLTPIETIENDQEISNESLLPIDDNPVLFVDEVELMPVSSGFAKYPYDMYTTQRQSGAPTQIISRAPQFRNNQRDKTQNGFNSNFKSKPNGKLPPPRPTAVKQSPRSDTFTLPTKRNEINSKVSKNNSVTNGFRPMPPKEHFGRSSSPPPQRRRIEPTHRNGNTIPASKYRISPIDQEDLGRKPLRFANKRNNAYHPPTPPPIHYQKSAPSSRDPSNKSRHVRIANNEYVVERRRRAPQPEYVYDDYHSDSLIERRRPQRFVRVLREPSYQEDDDVYYTEPVRTRRAPVIRKSQPTEYVYVDENPAPIHYPRRTPGHRSEVIYVDEDQPIEYEDIYVDENGNEVDFVNERNQSPEYVQYIYDDDDKITEKRRSHKPKIVYVDDDPPPNQQRLNKKKSKQPSTTRIVYE